jgi:hypothetical protein
VNDPLSPCDTHFSLRKLARACPGQACLIHIYPTGPDAGRRHTLGDRSVVIGREAECDVQPNEQSVSRRHARIDPHGDAHTVRDLGSSNGTLVNDETVAGEWPLRDGDYLRVTARAGSAVHRPLHPRARVGCRPEPPGGTPYTSDSGTERQAGLE